MIDFYNNTYVVRRTEKDVVIKILKKHPEYRGFGGKYEFNQRGIDKDNYDFLWKQIDDTFNDYSDEEFVYLDNEYITQSQIQQHSWLVGLLRPSTESIGLDFGMVSMFTTSDGERHGLSSFTKLKIWDKELLDLSQNLQKQSIKFSTNARYVQLQQRIKSYFKNEICRILNKLAKKNVGVFAVEHLDFRAAGMSKQMNRLIGRTYRSVVKAKLKRLEEQYGIQIIAVNPAYTSQECSRCHYVSKDNRKTQKDFVCQHCHFSCNADVNAGRVINQRRSLMLEFPVYAKRSTSRTVRCQVQEASNECHKRYCHDNGLMTYEESLAKGSL